MGSFFSLFKWMKRMPGWIGNKGDRVVIDQAGVSIPPPPAMTPKYGHYVAMKNNITMLDTREEMDTILGTVPGLSGAMRSYLWSEIEVAENTFDYTEIDLDMAVAASHGKRMVFQIEHITFRSTTDTPVDPVPTYLHAYSLPNDNRIMNTAGVHTGYARTAQIWHPTCRTAYARMINAVQSHCDGNAGYDGLCTQETALSLTTLNPTVVLGVPYYPPWISGVGSDTADYYPGWGPSSESPCGSSQAIHDAGNNLEVNGVQYTATAFCNAWRDIIIDTASTRPNSRFIWWVNWIAHGQSKTGPWKAAIEAIAETPEVNCEIGGPDIHPPMSHQNAGIKAYPLSKVNGQVYPRMWKTAHDLGLKLSAGLMFNSHEGPPYPDGTVDTSNEYGNVWREYNMLQHYIWATSVISPEEVDAPGTGNSHGWVMSRMFWWNIEPEQTEQKYKFLADDAPVINAYPYDESAGRFPEVV